MNYIKTPRRLWYIYKNNFNIGQCNNLMTARDSIVYHSGICVTPRDMEFFEESILWKDKLNGDIYEARLEEVKR